MSGAFVLLPLIPLRRLRQVQKVKGTDAQADGAAGTSTTTQVGEPDRVSWGSKSLWLFAVVCFLALTGESLRLTYLPILAVDRLGVPLWLFGVLVSVAPVVELAAMPAAGALADRFGMKRVILGGLLLGAGGFAAFAISSSVVGLLIGQFCNACFIAVLLGLGVTYAQRLHPNGAGFAASVFFAAQSLTIASAGLLGAALANRPSGLPDLFFTALMLNATAVGLLLFIKPPQIVGADPAERAAGAR